MATTPQDRERPADATLRLLADDSDPSDEFNRLYEAASEDARALATGWQAVLRDMLEGHSAPALVETGDTERTNYARHYDRVARNQQRPQRFGTQGICVDGAWELLDTESLDELDERRAQFGLAPLDEHRWMHDEYCSYWPDL